MGLFTKLFGKSNTVSPSSKIEASLELNRIEMEKLKANVSEFKDFAKLSRIRIREEQRYMSNLKDCLK